MVIMCKTIYDTQIENIRMKNSNDTLNLFPCLFLQQKYYRNGKTLTIKAQTKYN